MTQEFMDNLKDLDMGPLKYEKKFSIWNTAKNCAATVGKNMAVVGAIHGATGGTAFVPGVGTVSGAVGGALAGMFYGTVACTAMNVAVKNDLKKIFE
jgi:hypothetical protein